MSIQVLSLAELLKKEIKSSLFHLYILKEKDGNFK